MDDTCQKFIFEQELELEQPPPPHDESFEYVQQLKSISKKKNFNTKGVLGGWGSSSEIRTK